MHHTVYKNIENSIRKVKNKLGNLRIWRQIEIWDMRIGNRDPKSKIEIKNRKYKSKIQNQNTKLKSKIENSKIWAWSVGCCGGGGAWGVIANSQKCKMDMHEWSKYPPPPPPKNLVKKISMAKKKKFRFWKQKLDFQFWLFPDFYIFCFSKFSRFWGFFFNILRFSDFSFFLQNFKIFLSFRYFRFPGQIN